MVKKKGKKKGRSNGSRRAMTSTSSIGGGGSTGRIPTIKQDPVYKRTFRFNSTTSQTSVIGSGDLINLVGTASANTAALASIMASVSVVSVRLFDTSGATVSFEWVGSPNSRSVQFSDTGTSAFASMIKTRPPKNSQAIWDWSTFGSNVPLFQITNNSSNAYCDVTLEFSISNENANVQTTTNTAAAGSTYVLALDQQTTSRVPKWKPIPGFLTII